MPIEPMTPPTSYNSDSDWHRFFPGGDHRWVMGLRRGDAAAFFAPRECANEVKAERDHWLISDPDSYAALTTAAEPAVSETVDLVQTFGIAIESTNSKRDELFNLGRELETDIVWLVADEAGTYRVAGGVVCFPSSWALRDKLGKTLSETHRPVPGLNESLDRRIETFLNRMVPGEAWFRENAGYSRSPERNQHPSRHFHKLDANVNPDEIWVRLERQLLLKLPLTHSVLFAIRVEAVPLKEVLKSRQAALDLTRLLTTLSPEAAEYKGLIEAREAIVSLCRLAH